MVTDAKWALAKGIAALDFVFTPVKVERLLAGLLVASIAKVSAVEADIEGDIAAEPALVVNVFVSVGWLAAGELAETKLFRQAFRTAQLLLLNLPLLPHGYAAINHAAEVGAFALGALVKRARAHG